MESPNGDARAREDEGKCVGIAEWRYLPPVLDSDGCALLLGMRSGREVLRLARERRLPSVKVGKRVMFLTDEVIATLRRLQRPTVLDGNFTRRGRADRQGGKDA